MHANKLVSLPMESFNELHEARQQAIWDQCIERLQKLAGQDPGWFYLAVHSLMEAWMNAQDPLWQYNTGYQAAREQSFKTKIASLCDRNPSAPWNYTLKGFADTYGDSTAVRHHFANMNQGSAHTAGMQILLFSKKATLGSPEKLAQLERAILTWHESGSMNGLLEQLRQLQQTLAQEQANHKITQTTLQDLKKQINGMEAQERELALLEARLEQSLLETKTTSRAESDAHRQQIWAIREDLRKKEKELESHRSALDLLSLLRNIHQTSRTQLDYQRTMLRLSDEQEDILSSYKPGTNFLVRGGAGTGKTLVLIKAIQAVRKDEESRLALGERHRILLLTFTKTLIRYGRFLGDLVARGQSADNIQTVDSWMAELCQQLTGKPVTTCFKHDQLEKAGLNMPDKDTWNEIEEFIWARSLSHKEYVTEAVPRTGRLKALRKESRDTAWVAGEALYETMKKSGTYSRLGLRRRILEALESGIPSTLERYHIIAIDEVQDLYPADLRIVNIMAGESVIMAGDTQQSLYQAGFTFKSIGLDIERKTRILKKNYRNTRQIEAVANSFLADSGLASAEGSATTAIRDGLPPRLSVYAKKEGFKNSLNSELDYLQTVLGYSDESIAIVHPGLCDDELRILQATIRNRQSHFIDIKKNESWLDSPHIRLSTIHSAKGIDFPAVILLLPRLRVDHGVWPDHIRHGLEANLLYVGLTRALETLSVIMPDDTQSTCLVALKKCFQQLPSGSGSSPQSLPPQQHSPPETPPQAKPY